MLFALWLACLPHNAAEVQALADDPEQVDRLVRALRSPRDEVWKTAYAELLEAGSEAASPELRESVIKGKTEAPRALLVLGELGDPDNFDLLAGAQQVPSLQSWADEAFLLAEESLYYSIRDEPTVAVCEAYLLWFPEGPSVREVQDILYDEQAWQAFEALVKPDEVDLISFVRAWPSSLASRQAYRELGQLRVRAAEEELRRGRPERALDALAQARAYDPDLDTKELEAVARQDLGRALLEHAEVDKAILELEEARRLGARNEDLLGTLYLRRAQERFERLEPVGGMEDLRHAEEVDPGLAETVGGLRELQVRALLEQIEQIGKGRAAAVEAVLMAGPAHHEVLSKVLMAAVDRGDCVPLVQAAHVADRHGAEVWVRSELARALAVADERVSTFLHPTNVGALLDGDAMFSLDSRSFRGEALGQLVCYERLVGAAQKQRDLGADFGKVLPGPAPRTDEELAARAKEGLSPAMAEQPKLFRAQLLRWVLEGPERLAALVQRNPALVASALVRSPEPPTDLMGWRLFEWTASQAGPETPVKLGQASGALRSERDGTVLRLIFDLEGETAQADLGPALTVLFGGARLFFFALPAVERVEVVVLNHGSEQAMLGMDRRSAERFTWGLIEAEAPYGAEHLDLVLDQRLK